MTCTSNGEHRLPAGEQSWKSQACDTLVAAGLDRCAPCQRQLITEMTLTFSDDFGRLFTTWVLSTFNRHVQMGARLPDNVLDMFGPGGQAFLSPPSRKALRGVKMPRQPGSPAAAVRLETKSAAAALREMTPKEREMVLDDALDGIIGAITAPPDSPAL